jgi:polysaccharide pyruvyl transferase CsaB
MYRVGISGSYGGRNLGDEAILAAMVASLRAEADAEFTVFTTSAADTSRRHIVDRAVETTGLSEDDLRAALRECDLLLLGGGGILFDDWVTDQIRVALTARELDVPLMLYALGAGPLKTPAARLAVRRCADGAEAVTVRDRQSRRVLEDAGVVHAVEVTADPALLLEPEPLPEGWLEEQGLAGKRLVGMSVRERGPAAPRLDSRSYHQLLAEVADHLADCCDATIVFVSLERAFDFEHSAAVVEAMHLPERAVIVDLDSSRHLLALAGEFVFAVGMRLHFLIFAALQGVPLVGLPYAAKIDGFMESLGLDVCRDEAFTSEGLLAFVEDRWDRREGLRQEVRERVPALQERSRRNVEIALGILSGQPAPAGPRLGR